MTARHLAFALALGGLAQPLWADHAGHSGGGSSGGNSGSGSSGGNSGGGSSVGHSGSGSSGGNSGGGSSVGHNGGGSSGGNSGSGSSGGHSGSSGGHSGGGSSGWSSSGAYTPSPGTPHSGAASSGSSGTTLAERRHPRAGTGTGGFYRSYPYYRYLSYSFLYGSFCYGWYDPFYDSGYYGAPGYYRGYGDGDRASLRMSVNPDKTLVFVDGYYAGIADDFDGLFKRLHVSPGRHEITLKLEGYRTHRVKVYVDAGSTLKIHYDMAKGSGEDPAEDLAGEAGGDADRYDDGEGAATVLLTAQPTPSVPVISNMTAVFTANTPCIRAADALRGRALVITFNYADSGADVSGGRVQLSRTYNTGRSESHFVMIMSGAPMSGHIQVPYACPRYNDDTSSTETISLFDASGNVSNSLSVTVDRPTGAP
jgi:hypothetical protein